MKTRIIFIGIAILLLLMPIFIGTTANCNKIEMCAEQSSMEQIASFSTNYQTSGKNRKHNVRLALSSLNGTEVEPNEEISFNKIVGERNATNGYKQALVILNGSYVEGFGGGVCQVSTTLYNAWLLAGLDVVFAKAHSLPSSYVDLSRDATVSEQIDLILKNTSQHKVKIKTTCDEQNIFVSIFGQKSEYEYKLISQTLKIVSPKEQTIKSSEVEKDEFYQGKNGFESRLILAILKNGKVVAKREIRRDYYLPQDAIKIIKI